MSSPPPDDATRSRMRDAHAQGARALDAEPSGPEAWGWEGRTLGRRAGHLWLRVLSMSEEKAGGRLWEGTATAAEQIPAVVPRPKLVGIGTWTNDGHAYRAELTEYVTLPVLQAGGPVLEQSPYLPDAWWAALRRAVNEIATVPTNRQAVRQQWIDRGFPAFLGIPPVTAADWTTGHGDLHFRIHSACCCRSCCTRKAEVWRASGVCFGPMVRYRRTPVGRSLRAGTIWRRGNDGCGFGSVSRSLSTRTSGSIRG
ncbi:hypothetical protein AQJ67_25735 [Streptomyces caeruleatus]|uniref:Uncharacterized protein n=1 Tax=Streptomyces caeruleatus TaxID=661399 RepID=A0A117RMR7_9ACTN|nr:hypothetical protein AQJ67_25735 [Streptomyces caeruleatus]